MTVTETLRPSFYTNPGGAISWRKNRDVAHDPAEAPRWATRSQQYAYEDSASLTISPALKQLVYSVRLIFHFELRKRERDLARRGAARG